MLVLAYSSSVCIRQFCKTDQFKQGQKQGNLRQIKIRIDFSGIEFIRRAKQQQAATDKPNGMKQAVLTWISRLEAFAFLILQLGAS